MFCDIMKNNLSHIKLNNLYLVHVLKVCVKRSHQEYCCGW